MADSIGCSSQRWANAHKETRRKGSARYKSVISAAPALAPGRRHAGRFPCAETRHHLAGKQLDRAARFLEGEIAEGETARHVIHAGLIDLRLKLIAYARRRAADHAPIRA